ncbi:30S ribosomal protein S6 [Candidatus Karelsulcia muelleri]|uniref:30S ribosomal protein S6 n=1 Tax=Candidatus Karelsulcia muelleri TaxID=336810 RepID=UPI00194EE747|nr:30S ribosomal protein S6 [Candidatus Karelsulcia muelleri]
MDLKSAFYETLIVISPTVSEEEKKQIISSYENFLRREGRIIYQIKWGKKKLAYIINKKRFGIYHIFYCKILKSSVKNLEKKLNQDENVIRFLILKIKKKALNYFESKVNITLNKKLDE